MREPKAGDVRLNICSTPMRTYYEVLTKNDDWQPISGIISCQTKEMMGGQIADMVVRIVGFSLNGEIERLYENANTFGTDVKRKIFGDFA